MMEKNLAFRDVEISKINDLKAANQIASLNPEVQKLLDAAKAAKAAKY
jgi:two-component SAPR family response regulator